MATVRVFHSHIEVSPYHKGDVPYLEKLLSGRDLKYGGYYRLCYYIDKFTDTLYIPRGVSIPYLNKVFNTMAISNNKPDPYKKMKCKVTASPKSKIQKEAIDFLTCSDVFTHNDSYSQFSLNLDQGDGKTGAAIMAIAKLKLRAIIILHQNKLKSQWIESVEKFTDISSDRVLDISGSAIIKKLISGDIDVNDYDIFCVTHQTITSFANDRNWNEVADFFKILKVGIKVIDEVHLFFENSFMIDCFSNTYKTFYLTATFSRSNISEVRAYDVTFANTVRFGEETYNYEEKRKHINIFLLYFRSVPSYGIKPDTKSTYGFSSYKYIDYELNNDSNNTLRKVLTKIINITKNLEGKTLILSPKIETVYIIAKYVEEITGEYCGTICSENPKDLNEKSCECRYISSTAKSSGTGVDIHGLRILIDLEPVSSKLYMDQIRGRLREYSPDKDTYLFIPVDTTLPDVSNMINRLVPSMRKKSKKIIKKNMFDI